MNPTNEILEEFEGIKMKFENIGNKIQRNKTNKMVYIYLTNKP